MKRSLFSTFLLTLLVAGNMHANTSSAESAKPVATKADAETTDLKAEQIADLSEAFGHILAQHIKTLGIDFDVKLLVKGLQDAHQGKPSPMDEMKCVETLTAARQQAFLRIAKNNLQAAEQFIQEASKKEGVLPIEEGKLYYRIERQGEGSEVAKGQSALIRYKGTFIDGTVFGASKEDDVISVDETIPGFGKGLLGMKEGEKRTLYIHPELAYGTNGQLPPNSLLVFEVELIKANAPDDKTQSISRSPQEGGSEKEISQADAPTPSKNTEHQTIR